MTRSVKWAWIAFWLVVALQIADLASTQLLLASGRAHEGNAFVERVLSVPGAPLLLKAAPIFFLSGLIVLSVRRGWPSPGRLLVTICVIMVVYVGVVANNVLLLVSLARTR